MSDINENSNRVRHLNAHSYMHGSVLYWMSRDQRVEDNWALLYAQKKALEHKVPLAVVFVLQQHFLHASTAHFQFMLEGLKQVEESLAKKHIPFYLLSGVVEDQINSFVQKQHIGMIVTDFSPLRIGRKWRDQVAASLLIPLHEVDTHNIVPCWIASAKQEFGAYTLRPKIHKVLHTYLKDIPQLVPHKYHWEYRIQANTFDISNRLAFPSGQEAAQKSMKSFLNQRLEYYDTQRNDPAKHAQSDLSPYIHFGHISSQRVVLELMKYQGSEASKQAFMEEIIIRKELSDNFCLYNQQYDSIDGFPDWAKKSLDLHRDDQREFIYSYEEFEQGLTHDPLWNAAQKQMVHGGKMHGYMRMYWAKKILEWTKNPEDAMKIAIQLNDTYELDGRDPNGYTGIAWAIGGVHDRAWFDRPVFGKIRYMNYNGCKSKFDVNAYISQQTYESIS